MVRPEHTQAEEAELSQDVLWDDDGSEESRPVARRAGRTVRTSQAFTEGITSTARIPGPSGFFFADVPNRIVAMVLDIIVLSIIGFVLAVALGGLATPPGAIDSPGAELDLVAFFVVIVLELAISVVYFGYLWVVLRGTLGMRLLGLQVGDEKNGHNIGWSQALIRWAIIGVPSVLVSMAVYVPSAVGLLASVIGLVWLALLLYTVARSATKQGLQDRYAHTVILKRRRRAV